MADGNEFKPTEPQYPSITLQPFRAWCQIALPAIYDDSLSYYELLCKMLAYLNDMASQVENFADTTINNDKTFRQEVTTEINNFEGDVIERQTDFENDITTKQTQFENRTNTTVNNYIQQFNTLKSWVNNYFDNLDVQNEINQKLDTMAGDGSLTSLIQPFFSSYQSQIDTLKNRVDALTPLTPGGTVNEAALNDIAVGDNGITYNTPGDATRGQYSENNSILSFSNDYKKIMMTIGEARALQTGEIFTRADARHFTNLLEIENFCIEGPFDFITYVHCFDSNQNFLRTILPFMQGNNRKIFLGQDVKFVDFSIISKPMKNYQFLKFIEPNFDFKYTIGYTYGLEDAKGISKTFTFDHDIGGFPVYGYAGVDIIANPGKKLFRSLGTTVPKYFFADRQYVTEGITSFTVPILLLRDKLDSPPYDGAFGIKLTPFADITIGFYGTSITNVNNEGRYGLFVRGLLPAKSITIRGQSGGRINNIHYQITTDPDTHEVAVIEGFANDVGSTTLQGMRDELYSTINTLRNRGAKRIFYVPDFTVRPYGNFTNTAATTFYNNQYTQGDFYKMCSNMLDTLGVETIEANAESGIYPSDEYYVDQIHQTYYGGFCFARAIAKGMIKRNFEVFNSYENQDDRINYKDYIGYDLI